MGASKKSTYLDMMIFRLKRQEIGKAKRRTSAGPKAENLGMATDCRSEEAEDAAIKGGIRSRFKLTAGGASA